MDLIRLNNITKTYHLGEVDVPVLKGVSLNIERGEMVALMGASRLGQDHADEPPRLPRPPDRRRVLARRRGGLAALDRPARPRPQPQDRLRLPELQPAAAHQRPGERDDAADLLAQRPARSARARERADGSCSSGSGWATACTTSRRSSPAASSSASRSPGRWSTSPPCCLPMSRPATSTQDQRGVLRMFQQLNQEEGITIMLVTHDPTSPPLPSAIDPHPRRR